MRLAPDRAGAILVGANADGVLELAMFTGAAAWADLGPTKFAGAGAWGVLELEG